MTYPDSFEQKIGFTEIRTLLKGRCLSSLGTEWVDNKVVFMNSYADVVEALAQAQEFAALLDAEPEVCEENFYDVRPSLLRIRPERTYMEEVELFELGRTLSSVCSLVQFLTCPSEEDADDAPEDAAVPYPALSRMAGGVTAFPAIVRSINDTLNRYGKVKDTASSELLSLRHQLEVTSRSISHTLRTIVAQAQSDGYIDRDVSPTLRDGRLVIPVAPALKRKIKGIIHDESASGKTVFIEPAAVVEANNRVRELRAAEKREVIRILSALTAEVRPHVPAILASMQFLAHVDYLRALSALSRSFESIVPEIKDEPMLRMMQAVHPLLHQSLMRHGGAMTPLDIALRGDARILLISGPNAGGKSVALKTVGLLQYMLQCGMPIPVGEATICGIFRGIFIDIGDEQSLEDELSTYSSHLLSMKYMMRHAAPDTLLLIDEFGTGTEPQIGGALAEAILHHLAETHTMGIITTHYPNLKHYAERSSLVVNGAMLYDRARLSPLFVLQVGNPGSSFAIEIARKIGIPESVIQQATNIVGEGYVMSDKYLQDIVRDKRYWETKRQNIRKREQQLEAVAQRYEEETAALHRRERAVIAEAKVRAEEILSESNARIESTIRTIRETQADKERTRQARQRLSDYRAGLTEESDAAPRAEDETAARIRRQMEKAMRRQRRKAEGNGAERRAPEQRETAVVSDSSVQASTPKKAFAVGDTVRLKGQTAVGRVEQVSPRGVTVRFGAVLSRNLPAERLEAAKEVNTAPVAATFVSTATRDAIYEKKLHFKPQLDLRGMRAAEAHTALAYFIDDAITLCAPNVRILHGTGTGALRELVRAYLTGVEGVARFHDEHVQFGGAGITVVEFS